MNELLDRISYCVERGKINSSSPFPADMKGKEGTDELTLKAVKEDIHPFLILNEGLIKGMQVVGEKFRQNKIFVPEVLIAAKAMKAGMVHLKPFFLSNVIQSKGTVVIGTVAGDLHDIGKNILGMMLQGGGWEIVDLGVDVSPEKFLNAVNDNNACAICLSALLTTTMLNMAEVIKVVKEKNPSIKILIGGAPVSNEFAQQINADFYSPDPQGALEYLNNTFSK